MTAHHPSGRGEKWHLLMQATIAAMIVVGAILLVAPRIGEAAFYFVYYQTFQAPNSFSEEARTYVRFTNAVLGAVLIGWMLLGYQLIARHADGRFSARPALMLSFGVWFIADTANSVLHAIWGNVILNLVVGAGVLIPLQIRT